MRARQGRRAADLRDEFLPGFDYNLPRLIAEAGKPARPDLRTGVSLASAPQRDHLRVALRWELARRALTGIQHSDFAKRLRELPSGGALPARLSADACHQAADRSLAQGAIDILARATTF